MSHDRYFINRIATSVAGVEGGSLERIAGDYDEYVACRARVADPLPGDSPSDSLDGTERERRGEARRREAEERNRRYRERQAAERRLGPLEAQIAELERRLGELRALQAEPALYDDAGRARRSGAMQRRPSASSRCCTSVGSPSPAMPTARDVRASGCARGSTSGPRRSRFALGVRQPEDLLQRVADVRDVLLDVGALLLLVGDAAAVPHERARGAGPLSIKPRRISFTISG